MKHELEAKRLQLLRLLRNELPPAEAEALRRRLAAEPELASAYRRVAAIWDGLELPAGQSVPLGFTGRVMTRVRQLPPTGAGSSTFAATGVSWSAAPRWVRAAGAAALLAGLALGAGLGLDAHGVTDDRATVAGAPALTDGYWVMVDESATSSPLPSPPESTRGEAGK